MQRDLDVGRVDRDRAGVGLAVERAAGRDERAGIGDRVADPVTVAAALDVHRLVEIAGARRVDRHERDVDPLVLRRLRGGRLGQYVVREALGNAGLAQDRVQPFPQRARRDDADATGGHALRLPAERQLNP